MLLGVLARRVALGLRYVEQPARQPPDSGHAEGGQRPEAAATAADSSSEKQADAKLASSGAASTMGRLLPLLRPRHRSGHWERPDAVLQQDLRRAYQGKWAEMPCGWLCLRRLEWGGVGLGLGLG